jgi:hypothetical protein
MSGYQPSVVLPEPPKTYIYSSDSRGVATMSFDETMLPAYLTDIVSHFSDWAYRALEAECLADSEDLKEY